MTSHPAEFFGLGRRGRVVEGWAADCAVVDLDHLELGPVELREDLPAGAERLFRSAHGWRATVVNGVIARREGEGTDARSGQVLRA
jgi:N-acyl-D-aspartate/D-glutamate deacylase